MLSKTCEYALRAMIYIAQHSKGGNMVNLKAIAESISSPQLFVGKILQGLSKQGYLQSSKGRYGGFYISDKEAKHSLADIISAIDGDKMFKGCGLGLPSCSEQNPCPIHNQYKKARELLYQTYSQTRLEQFKTLEPDQVLLLKRTT